MNGVVLALLVFIMTFAGTLGAIFFKKASAALSSGGFLCMLRNPTLYIGGGFYLLGAFLNIFLLKHMYYSVLYPMTSLTYIWTTVVSYFLFDEKINIYKITALCCIAAGIILLNL